MRSSRIPYTKSILAGTFNTSINELIREHVSQMDSSILHTHIRKVLARVCLK